MYEARLRSLIAKLATHVEAWVLEEPMALLAAAEWGVAFDSLCDNLYEGEIPSNRGNLSADLIWPHWAGCDRSRV